MKQTLCNYLRCPLCQTSLAVAATPDEEGIIWQGTLTCQNGHSFAIENGIPIMLAPELPGYASKMGEVAGWVKMSQDEGWYRSSADVDLALPYVVSKLGWDPVGASTWVGTEYSFTRMMQAIVRPGMRVLEIGAARTWAGRFFVEAGCDYIACDIMADEQIGLGRAHFFMEHFGCHYEAVAADAEALPFADGAFDLVFAIAALHHALDLPQMLQEMARVTRRGGHVVGLAEGVRAFNAGPDAETQSTEKTYGINEHVHSLWGYYWASLQNRLWITSIHRAAGNDWLLSDKHKARVQQFCAIPLIGEWLATLYLVGFIHDYDGVSFYCRKV